MRGLSYIFVMTIDKSLIVYIIANLVIETITLHLLREFFM